MFVPSHYHTAISNSLAASDSHLVIAAGPGSGKTTTGVKVVMPALIAQRGRGMAVAFNNHNARDFATRLGGLASSVTCGTVHTVAKAALTAARGGQKLITDGGREKAGYCPFKKRYMPATPSKIGKIAIEVVGKENAEHAPLVAKFTIAGMTQALGLPGFPPFDAAEIGKLVERHPVELPEEMTEWVVATYRRNIAMRQALDFPDMIYFPILEGVRFPGIQWIFFDEAQDMTPLFLAFVLRVVDGGARLVAVGDRCQAINGFAGAMPEALERIREEFVAEVLPLRISYRCSVAACAEAARYFPDTIEPGPDALPGSVEQMKFSELDALSLPDGAACLSRTHKHLLPLALKLLRERRGFRYKGAMDVVASLERCLYRAANRVDDCAEARARLIAWQETAEAKAAEKGKAPQWLAHQKELVESLIILLTQVEAEGGTVAVLRGYFSRLLEMEKGTGPTLSTFHSSKGSEWGTVYILGPMESPLAATEEEKQAEKCVAFVALTRSSDKIIYVEM